MTTPNLAIPHIAASQNQKEVTANAAFDALDNAGNRALTVDVDAGNATLTNEQFRRNARFSIINATTAGRTVTLPASIQRMFLVSLSAASTAAVTVVRGSTSAIITPGEAAVLHSDGTNLTRVNEAIGRVRVVTETGTARTLSLADAGRYIRGNNAATITITAPLNATLALPVGFTVTFEQIGAGEVAFEGESGVTLNYVSTSDPETAGQYAVAQLVKVATDTWSLFGNLAEAA